MSVRVVDVDLKLYPTRTRLPFRYGIVEMRGLPHLIVTLTAEIDGQEQQGVSADGLAPKWFTKDPATSNEADQDEMLAIIRLAASLSRELPPQPNVFAWWRALYAAQADAAPRDTPPLLWNFGVSLIERAMIDAFCRRHATTFAAAVRTNALGVQLDEIHAELAGTKPRDWLPAEPQQAMIVRHTVGLSDPLTDADIPPAERLDDGLPQSLDASITAYGLTHFKLKLCGDADRDLARLHAIRRLFESRPSLDYAYTLDGNENYRDVLSFKTFWERAVVDRDLAGFLERLIFVEQPIHRDQALSDETRAALLAWPQRPPTIIDESDGELSSLKRGLACGYIGTSHKNCKGVFKGLINACLIQHRRRNDPNQRYELSGEDLSNIGPIALLQDLTVGACLGLTHMERNGQHYFAGLSMWPPALQQRMLALHGDLYRDAGDGVARVKIHTGRLAMRSLVEAPFGVRLDPDEFGSGHHLADST